MNQLTHLIINDNDIRDEGTFHISTSMIFENLTFLDIKQNELRENGAHMLSVSQVLTQL